MRSYLWVIRNQVIGASRSSPLVKPQPSPLQPGPLLALPLDAVHIHYARQMPQPVYETKQSGIVAQGKNNTFPSRRVHRGGPVEDHGPYCAVRRRSEEHTSELQ